MNEKIINIDKLKVDDKILIYIIKLKLITG